MTCSCGKPFPENGGTEGVCECCSGCTPTPDEIDQRLAVLAILTARIKAEDATLREQRRASIRPGQRSPVILPGDDTEVAWVSMTRPSGGGALTASVRDLDALLRWCREHRPGAITETVRPSDQAAILTEVKTGRLTEVPDGVEVNTTTASAPTLRVNCEDGDFDALLAAVRDGRVDTMLALGGAE